MESKEVPKEKRVALVVTRFRHRASSWLQQSEVTRARHQKPKIVTWAKFRKHLEREFHPYNFESALYKKFHDLTQGLGSVDDYTAEFYNYQSRLDVRNLQAQLEA